MNKITYIEDPELEAKYKTMERLGSELGGPVPQTYLEVKVLDNQGRTIHAHRQRSHSWNRNAYNWFYSQFGQLQNVGSTFGPGAITIKDTGGSIRVANVCIFINTPWLGYKANAGQYDRGIIVGSGNEAEAFDCYSLQSVISHGTGAGQLDHAASDLPLRSWNDSSRIFSATLARFFNNNSGGDVDVNEVGLVAGAIRADSASDRCALVSRDVLASTVTVPDTGQLKVTYTIEIAYPE
jgi:hypothetical protein